MPSFADKLSTYLRLSNASTSTIARHLGLTPAKLSKLLAGELIDLEPEALSRLAQGTGVPESIWKSDTADLPADLSPVKAGRKTRDETPDYKREQNLRRQRLEEVISQVYEGSPSALADAMGQQVSAISHYLSRRTITESFILKVAKATGVSAQWLLTGKGSMGDRTTAPPVSAHQGEQLGRYLDDHQISNRALGLLMGYSETVAAGSVRQFRNSRQLSPDVTAKILQALQVTKSVVFPDDSQNSTKIDEQNDVSGKLYKPNRAKYLPNERVKNYDVTANYVTVPTIPARARTGFSYSIMRPQLSTKQLPITNLRRANNPALTPAERADIIASYDVITIGPADFMEPEMRAGDEVVAYRVPQDVWPYQHNRFYAVQHPGGLFLGFVRETIAQAGVLTLHPVNPQGGTLTVALADIVYLWELERVERDL